jgi:hypothetical protein
MEKDSKKRLFEVMGRVDSSFKPKLNEEYNEPFPIEDKPVDEMANWGKTRANPAYSHFAVLKNINPAVDGKIFFGWEYRDYDQDELRQFKKDYFFRDVEDNQVNPKNVNILTAKYLQRQGIDPYDYKNWYNGNDEYAQYVFTL